MGLIWQTLTARLLAGAIFHDHLFARRLRSKLVIHYFNYGSAQFRQPPVFTQPDLGAGIRRLERCRCFGDDRGALFGRSADGKKFASIDPEEFYDFYRQRPVVRLNDTKVREIHWPSYDFYHGAGIGIDKDFILGIGAEPHLRWRTFTETMLRFARECAG